MNNRIRQSFRVNGPLGLLKVHHGKLPRQGDFNLVVVEVSLFAFAASVSHILGMLVHLPPYTKQSIKIFLVRQVFVVLV